ncbi:phage distal tail protein [Devriesea agamarum]|uniref:phage distal tail protein n=1 Tax=Devriesea agamarum TaxID=472569 RepID=UPI00155E793D|nr:phage tail domain-containing protein [Devriesea agamarum]
MSFSRAGQTLTLGRGPEDPVLHIYGSTGLGLAPSHLETVERLADHGSVVVGQRYTERKLFIPIFAQFDGEGGLTGWRGELYALLAPHLGPVDIHIYDPATDRQRYISGYLDSGLEGDFGQNFHGNWQTLGLTFRCPDPWWQGPERLQTFSVTPSRKPFISTTSPFFPVLLAASTVLGRFDVTIDGDGPINPVWEVIGPGRDLVISNGSDHLTVKGAFPAGQVVRFDGRTDDITPDRWADVDVNSTIFPLSPGLNRLTVTLTDAGPESLVRLTYRERYLGGM